MTWIAIVVLAIGYAFLWARMVQVDAELERFRDRLEQRQWVDAIRETSFTRERQGLN